MGYRAGVTFSVGCVPVSAWARQVALSLCALAAIRELRFVNPAVRQTWHPTTKGGAKMPAHDLKATCDAFDPHSRKAEMRLKDKVLFAGDPAGKDD
ncbi:hypothetical protein DI396_10260 [Litorivita pollutaquae]|uniref:Uncharacterized protein n=1 Tax=Litorivita pollutaquae TaxID=2200892 RepID=A0A2V4ML11_9RHOB|nr:hypothetical protein DI396_10260 [Litorivita pollutaquae]